MTMRSVRLFPTEIICNERRLLSQQIDIAVDLGGGAAAASGNGAAAPNHRGDFAPGVQNDSRAMTRVIPGRVACGLASGQFDGGWWSVYFRWLGSPQMVVVWG